MQDIYVATTHLDTSFVSDIVRWNGGLESARTTQNKRLLPRGFEPVGKDDWVNKQTNEMVTIVAVPKGTEVSNHCHGFNLDRYLDPDSGRQLV